MSTSRLTPYTETPGATPGDRRYLEALGRISDLTMSKAYPGGPKSLEFSIACPPDMQSPALQPGRMISVHRGATKVWYGRISDVERGTPWHIQCVGIGSFAVTANAPTTGTIDAIIDQAITNGLPWTRPASVSTARSWSAGYSGLEAGSVSLDEVLTKVLATANQRWKVNAAGQISVATDPTVPTNYMRASGPIPLSLNNFATAVLARYQLSTGSHSTVFVKDDAAIKKWGYVEDQIDLGFLVLDNATATTYATNYLNTRKPRLVVSGAFEVSEDQIYTALGGAVDGASFNPGSLIRVMLASNIRDAFLLPQTNVDVIVGGVDYQPDTKKLKITPIDSLMDPWEQFFGAGRRGWNMGTSARYGTSHTAPRWGRPQWTGDTSWDNF